jgi:predicted DNA-binding transcriptional regulator AlpA
MADRNDSADHTDPADPLVRWPYCAKGLGGISRRTLNERIRRNEFPQPDRPARVLGEAHQWRKSTADRGIREYAEKRAQPKPSDKAA